MTSSLSSLSQTPSSLGPKFGSSASSSSFAKAAQELGTNKPFFRTFSSTPSSTPATKDVASNISEDSSSHSPGSLSSFAPVTNINALDVDASKKEESGKSGIAKFGADAKERAAMKPKTECRCYSKRIVIVQRLIQLQLCSANR